MFSYSLAIGFDAPKARPSFVVKRHLALRRKDMRLPFRIPQEWIDGIIYLYPDEQTARSGEQIGGTGFLLGWPIEGRSDFTLWAVTNRHVIDQGNWTIRLNAKSGGLAYQDTTDREWIFSPYSDLAVRPISLSQDLHKFSFITKDWLLEKEEYTALDMGPGDGCVTIGRFVGHAGKLSNNPVARFGQISQGPIEPVTVDGREQECLLVESRSIGGFSGSPVFVHLDPNFYRPKVSGAVRGQNLYQGVFPTGPWLLGVNYAMVPLWEKVRDLAGLELPIGHRVAMNTGLMAVAPAWHLIDLLEAGQAGQVRRAIEVEIARLTSIEQSLPVAITTQSQGQP